MAGLFLESVRCLDGCELHDYGPRPSLPLKIDGKVNAVATLAAEGALRHGKVFRFASARRKPFKLRFVDLEDAVVLKFATAGDDEALVQFFGEFGFLYKNCDEWPREDVLLEQSNFRRLLELAASDDVEPVAKIINGQVGDHIFRPVLIGRRQFLHVQSLVSLMLMELSKIVTEGARLASCGHCGVLFLTGSQTGRRRHARYCCARCRVRAMRARNAA